MVETIIYPGGLLWWICAFIVAGIGVSIIGGIIALLGAIFS